MKTINYKMYSKNQMLKIIQNDAFLFIETNLGDNYIIKQKDLADFIVLEALRTGHIAEIKVYMPGIDEPVLTTFGWFLNRVNPLLRDEILDRLILLQTTDTNPRNVKIFNNEIFNNFSQNEMGIENGEPKNFNKFYRKYVFAKNKYNIEMEGV